jgi:hypothetical protein
MRLRILLLLLLALTLTALTMISLPAPAHAAICKCPPDWTMPQFCNCIKQQRPGCGYVYNPSIDPDCCIPTSGTCPWMCC